MARKSHDAATVDFIHSVGSLVRRVRSAAASHEISMTESAVMRRLEIDGGVKVENAASIAKAQAEFATIGTAYGVNS